MDAITGLVLWLLSALGWLALLPLAMAKSVHDDVLDGALNIVKNNCTRMTLCSAEPTTYTEGNATFALADVTMAAGDFTAANGDTSGRKLTVAAKNAVPVDASGTSTHVALLDVTNSKLLYVTTHTSQALTSGNTANIGSWKIEIADPT
jgi:Flp pilus assembly protein TadG